MMRTSADRQSQSCAQRTPPTYIHLLKKGHVQVSMRCCSHSSGAGRRCQGREATRWRRFAELLLLSQGQLDC